MNSFKQTKHHKNAIKNFKDFNVFYESNKFICYIKVSQTFCSWVDNYRFTRVPPKFYHIFSCKAQLALMHNLFSIARQPITFPLNLLNL